MNAADVCAAIGALKADEGNLRMLLGALETFANNIPKPHPEQITRVCDRLLDAWVLMDPELTAYEARMEAA